MRTPASIAGHPIHPMLVGIPIGLWLFSFAADIFCLMNLAPGAVVWRDVGYFAMVGGLLGALAAAIPGAIDLFSLEDPRIRRVGFLHMGINLFVVALYAGNAWLRTQGGSELGEVAVMLSAVGLGMLAVSGWLGGRMVFVHGVAVDATQVAATPDAVPRPAVPRRGIA